MDRLYRVCRVCLLVFPLLFTHLPANARDPVCRIRANGTDGALQVDSGRSVSISIGMDPGDQDGHRADWWLVRFGPDGLWFLDLGGTPHSEPYAVYQGPLFSIPPKTPVLDLTDLVAGGHMIYFGVDLLQNSLLDSDPVYYASVSVTVASSVRDRLKNARFWMYQIQDLDADGAVEALARSNYPLLVVEPGQNFSDYPYDTAQMVADLRTTPKGLERVLLAYVDIGQAEDFRDYWQPDWQAPTSQSAGYPDFLLAPDPDGWSGDFQVAYWRESWRQLWLGDAGIIAQLAKLGFDGVYLDWVGAYDDDPVREAAQEDGVETETEMIRFIEDIRAAGRAVNPQFLVVPQNASYLLDADPDRYAAAIDALAVEDTWFSGEGDAEWDDPDAGDLQNQEEGDFSTQSRLAQYQKYLDLDLPVFSVDYCILQQNADDAYETAEKYGLRPLVTRVSLSRMTVTPHPLADLGDKDGQAP